MTSPGKTWKILCPGGPEGIAEYAVAVSTRRSAWQAFLAAGLRPMGDPPALTAPVAEALARPGLVFEKDWRDGSWRAVAD